MSQIKERILKLLQSSKIDGRYRTIWDLYPNNANYALLAYHSVDHVKAVLNLFEVLRKLSGKGFDKTKLDATYLAAAFHDINHSGYPDSHVSANDGVSDGTNIGYAVEAYMSWAFSQSKNPANMSDVILLIKSTEYPSKNIRIDDPELLELSNMLRDADMLWGTMPGNAEQCMIGLWAERRNAGLADDKLDVLVALTNQIKFIQNYQPLSSAGRTYKNAMFKDAAVAWAEAALYYQRQIEAVNIVNELSDGEALQLAAAIQARSEKQ
jgi:hypothetical protein